MQETLLQYDEIIEYFGEQTIKDRFKFFYDKMSEYIVARDLKGILSINEAILQQLVMDYFTDVYRLKKFHRITNINKTKILAYELYWLLRRKPLQICSDTDESKIVFCNEGFAITMLASEFLAPYESEPLTKEKEDVFFGYLDHLYYHFKYREVDKQCLETIIFSFKTGLSIASTKKVWNE